MTQADDANPVTEGQRAARPAGQEAPPHPALDPTKKTTHTSDPTADDPGNGAD
jgi:hypothetical protein